MPSLLTRKDSRSWFVQPLAILAVSALFVLALGQYADLDLWFADRYFDPAS